MCFVNKCLSKDLARKGLWQFLQGGHNLVKLENLGDVLGISILLHTILSSLALSALVMGMYAHWGFESVWQTSGIAF